MVNAPAAVVASARAVARNVPLSPQKGRLVADLIRGLPVEAAMEKLQFSRRKAGAVIRKVLSSAIANAEEKRQSDIDALVVCRIEVSDGWKMKRVRFHARGRVGYVIKRRSHILVEIGDAKQGK